MEEAAESVDSGGSDEAYSGQLTPDYISKTISDATSRMGASKYLDQEEGAEPEPKKQPRPGEQQPDEPEEDEPEDEGSEEPEEGQTDRKKVDREDAKESSEAKTEAKWHQYRKAYQENSKLKAELNDLRRKVEATGNVNEVAQLRGYLQQMEQEREELRHQIEVSSVEYTPRWKAEIVQPLDRMWGNIQSIAKRNSLDPNKLAALVANGDDTQIEEYAAEARPGDRSHLYAMIPACAEIEERKKWLKDNAREIGRSDWEAMQRQRHEQMQGIIQQRQGAYQHIAPKLEERILRFIPKDKRPDLKGAAATILDFENWKEDVKMYAGQAAFVLPEVLDQWKATRIALKEAKNELIKLRGGTPKSSAGSKGPSRSVVADNGDDVDLNAPIREITAGMTKRIRGAMGYR